MVTQLLSRRRLIVLALAGALLAAPLPVSAQIPGNYAYAVAITPSNTTNYVNPGSNLYADAVYVGGAGVVVLVLTDSTTVSLTAVAGAILPIRSIRVNSTNTTATLLVALYYSA